MNKSWVCDECGSINPKEQLRCHKCHEIRLNGTRDIPIEESLEEYRPRTELRQMREEKYGSKDDI